MFVLSQMKDTVRLAPNQLGEDTTSAIIKCLNAKFANKVVHGVGLCIALWDIEKFEDSYIYPGDGASHTVVHFRYVVFRPFIEEVLIGKVKNYSKEGIHVSIGFFDDIFIPENALNHPSHFDEQEQRWAWQYDDGVEKHNMYIDPYDEIRFKVQDERFVDTTPTGPKDHEASSGTDLTPGPKIAPYTIIASIAESGLGLLSWWNDSEG